MKLSIITINYNNLEGLKKTVDSVLSQTWRDFEWIIVDGGSTDGSKEYIESLAQSLSEGTAIDGVQWTVERFSLPGFTAEDLKGNTSDSGLYQSSTDNRQSPIANRPQRLLWCSESDKGVYNAMNKGIAKAQGEYLNFMNSGDCFYENTTLQKVFNKTLSVDVLYGDCYWPNNKHISKSIKNLSVSFFYRKTLCHQATFIKTPLLQTSPYREDLCAVSDWLKFLEWKVSGCKFTHVGSIVACYDTSGFTGKNYQLVEFEREKELQTLYNYTNDLKFKFIYWSEYNREHTNMCSIKGVVCRALCRLINTTGW